MQNLIAILRLTVYLTSMYHLKDRSIKLLSVENMSTDWYQLILSILQSIVILIKKLSRIINYF